MTALEAALGYAARGWRVLPIRAAGKVPLTPHGVKDASSDQGRIRDWYRRWPDAGVGIATGSASGIVVLDVDPRSGGDTSAAALAIPATLTSRTGGGGAHYVFAARPGPRRGRSAWRPGLDVKGDGGYIVAPPSRHASGGLYAWVDHDVPLAPEPHWLTEACDPAAAPVPVSRPTASVAVQRARKYVAALPAAVSGQGGHSATFAVARRLVDLDWDDALDVLLEYNTRCDPPWSRTELEHKLRSAREGGRHTGIVDRPHASPRVEPIRDGIEIPDKSWMDRLIWDETKEGKTRLRRCPENAVAILRYSPQWTGRLRYDSFRRDVAVDDPPWHEVHSGSTRSNYWTDLDDTRLQGWLTREFRLDLGVQDCRRAVAAVAATCSFNPVKEWMDELQWDGTPRIGRWLTDYLGADENDYTAAVGRWWIISAVARVFQPGCKADHLLVLGGDQGIGKSSSLRTLTGADWFSDTPLDLNNKDAYLAVQGRLVIELSELESLRGAAIERAKAFFSSQCDSFRAPYASRNTEHPRQCVFAGTTNSRQFLLDGTGARRFWGVWCGSANTAALASDREQIWAEAIHAYRSGARWWPEGPSETGMVADAAEEFFVNDTWESAIYAYLNGKDECSISNILTAALGIDIGKTTRLDQMRVASVLTRSKLWIRRHGAFDGRRCWFYKRNSQ